MGYYVSLYNGVNDSTELLNWLSEKYEAFFEASEMAYERVFKEQVGGTIREVIYYINGEKAHAMLLENRVHRGRHWTEDMRRFNSLVRVSVIEEKLINVPDVLKEANQGPYFEVAVETIGIRTRAYDQMHAMNLAISYCHHYKADQLEKRPSKMEDRLYNFRKGWLSDEKGYRYLELETCTMEDLWA